MVTQQANARFETFSGRQEDWRQWKKRCAVKANSLGFLPFLDGSIALKYSAGATGTGPAATSAVSASILVPTRNELQRDDKVFTMLTDAVDGDAFAVVEAVPLDAEWKSHLAWKALCDKYEAITPSRMVELRQQYNNLQMTSSTDPDMFVSDLRYIRGQLKDNHVLYTDHDLLLQLVHQLPPDYSELMTTIEGRLHTLTLDEFMPQLRAFYRRKVLKASSLSPSSLASPVALVSAPAAPSASVPSCSHCRKTGHTVEQCWALHGKPDRGTSTKKKSNVKRKGKGKANGQGGKSGHSVNIAFTACRPATTVETGHAHSRARAPAPKFESWLIDSGCSAHVTGSSEHMFNLRTCTELISSCSGEEVAVVAIGDLALSCKTRSGVICEITISNVKFAPALKDINLFSVSQSVARGHKYAFAAGGAHVTAGAVRLDFVRHEPTNLWCLNLKRVPISSSGAVPSLPVAGVTAALAVDINDFHRRLGHLAHSNLTRLAKAQGVHLTGELVPCITCALHQSRRQPVSSSTAVVTNKPLQCVMTDLIGPISVPSLQGSKYGHVFVDDYSRFGAVIFLKSKDQTSEGLQSYLIKVVLPSGHKLGALRSDNGGEFTGDEFVELCVDKDIAQQFTPPYTPQMNGVAEKFLHTIVLRASCLLSASKLDLKFWAEAVATATYLYNRSPHSFLQGRTPFEVLTGRAPKLGHLREFGTLCFVHKGKGFKKLIEERSRAGVFIGYSHNRPTGTYRVYIPDIRSVIDSMHVRFHDTMYLDAPANMVPRREDRLRLPPDTSVYVELMQLLEQRNAQAHVPGDVVPRPPPPPGGNDGDAPGSGRGGDVPPGIVDGEVEVEVSPRQSPALSPRAADARDDADIDDSGFDAVPARALPPAQGVRTRRQRSLQHNAEPLSQLVTERGGARTVSQPNLPADSRGSTSMFAGLTFNPSDSVCFAFTASEPSSYEEAMRGVNKPKWSPAIDAEMASLERNGTWVLEALPAGRKAIKTRWLFKVKLDSAGSPKLYKARLVVQGFSQVAGVDFFETYAPVSNIATVRSVLALAACLDLELQQMDVDTAFLNAPVDEVIYATPPTGYQKYSADGTPLYYRLKRSLYGLKQSPRNWNSVINTWLCDFGLTRSTADPCLYVGISSDNALLYVVLYVDDLILASNSTAYLSRFKKAFGERFKVKDLGDLEFFVGIRIGRDRPSRSLFLDQSSYLERVLVRFGMETSKSVLTPTADFALSCDMAPSTDAQVADMADVPYRSAVGSLLYAAVCTRPDIAFATRCVSQYMQNPGLDHWGAVKRILRYLQGTLHLKLTYSFGASSQGIGALHGFCDADFGGDIDSRRSTTGYAMLFGPALVAWSSRLQPTVAQSSTEAEYMALSECVNEVTWLRNLYTDLHHPQQGPTVIFEDNQGAIKIASNHLLSRRSKHIDIKHHLIREHIAAGAVKVSYVRTASQKADCLTKGVPTAVLTAFIDTFFTA